MNNITSIYNKADRRASLRNRLMIFCFFIFTLTAAPGCDYFSYGHVPHRSDHIPGQDTPVGSTTSTTTAASPQFSPVAGTYDVDQSVVITCATSGATIYYTTDGSSPSASSSVYSAPISVAGNGTAMTIQAYAEKSGMNNSPVASALYNIAYPSAAAPTFSPLPGSYTTTQSVSISSTAGATIYYTIDGTTPTTASTVYSVPISVTGSGTSTTIKAFAVKAGLLASAVSTGVYTIDTTPPTLTTVTLVSNNANTILAKVGDQITLSITASEALSTPPVVTIAGVPVSVTTNSATTYSAMRIVASSDTEGPVAINISGYKDLAGNTGFSVTSPTSGSVAIDRTPPTVSITTPAVINNANKASYSVSGTCSENGIIVTVNAGGVTATPTCTTGSYTATAMNASVVGDNAALSVTANQTDAAGNVTTTSTTVLKDTINPTVSIGTAPTINNANKASYSVSGTCSENGIIVTVNAGGVTATPTCTTGSYTATAMNASGLADSAALSVTANQTDAAGNVTTTSTTVLKDTINPTVSIGTAPTINNANKASYSVSGTCSENGIIVTVNAGGVTATPTCTTGSYTATAMNASGLADSASVSVTANQTDAAGNVAAQASMTVVKDTVNPTVSIGTAPNINNANKASYSVSGACSENGVIVTVNAGGVTATPTCTTLAYNTGAMNVTAVTDGAAISVTANQTDAAGNVTTTSTTVLKDTINPTVSIGTAPTINNANKASYSVSGTCSENGIIVTVNAGGVTATPTCTTGTYTASAMNVSGLADNAAISITANHTDAAGNAATTTSTTVLKDTVAPSGYSVTITQTVINNANKTALSFTFAAAEVGASYNYSISSSGGGTNVTGTGTIATATDTISNINVSGLNDGTLTLSVTLTDAAGNTGLAATNTKTKDIIVPTITSVQTMDLDGNGKIDHYKITFSENVVDSTFPGYALNALGIVTTNWQVGTGLPYTNVQLSHGTAEAGLNDIANDNILYIKFSENTIPDTGAKPDLTSTNTVVADAAGNILIGSASNQTNTVLTADVVEIDAANPVVVSATNYGTISARITFSEVVVAAGAETATNYTITGLTVSAAAMYPTAGSNSDVVTLTTTAHTSGSSYTATLTTGVVSDMAVNKVTSPKNAATYTADLTAPTVVSTFPAAGAISVGRNVEIVINFSKTMDVSTLNLSFSVACGGPGVSGSFQVYGKSAVFSHYAGIDYSLSCTATLSTGAKDAAGNALAVATSFSFTTVTSANVATLAGSGAASALNGTGAAATFNYPSGAAIDNFGNIYVADSTNNLIRKVTPDGAVTTLAGGSTTTGTCGGVSSATCNDGAGTAARFSNPTGVAVDSSGNVYVADAGNNRIRKVTSVGVVTTLAGNGTAGWFDATGTTATFNYPSGAAIDNFGNIYVADSMNNRIRTITVSTGAVTTLAGGSTTTTGICGGVSSTTCNDGAGTAARFSNPTGVAVDSSGNVYVADAGNNRIRKIDSIGVVTTLAGSGTVGSTDGTGTAASFNAPTGVAVDGAYNIYVADQGNNSIRQVTLLSGVVTTPAGGGVSGGCGGISSSTCNDGTGTTARFNAPYGLAVNFAGNVYVADSGNNRIRKLELLSAVTTLAGGAAAGSANGTGTAASFNAPAGVAIDSSGNAYVADQANNLIRKIAPDGAVTTLAGGSTTTTGTCGGVSSTTCNDGAGTAARFNAPTGVAADSIGNIYVADKTNNRIRKVTSAGVVTTLAGSGTAAFADGTGMAASFNLPTGVAVDNAGNIYVADSGNHRIRKVTFVGVVTILAGSGTAGWSDATGTNAQFNNPTGVAVDSSGNVYVADSGNHRIRKVTFAGATTTLAGGSITTSGTCGGTNFLSTCNDGTGTAARFNAPAGVAVSNFGDVYVTDTGNYFIRKVTSSGVVTTLAGAAGAGSVDGTGTFAWFNAPYGLALDSAGNLYVADTANNRIRQIE